MTDNKCSKATGAVFYFGSGYGSFLGRALALSIVFVFFAVLVEGGRF